MKVLLVWPSVTANEATFTGNILPLGLGYLAANLPRRHEVRLWDGMLNRDSDNRLALEEIERFRPDVVGVSVWIFNMDSARGFIERIKARFPKVVVVVGGPNVSGLREKALSLLGADYGITGDGERPFQHLLEMIEQEALSPDKLKNVAGLVYRLPNGGIGSVPPRWEEMDGLNCPDYELIRLKDYFAAGFSNGPHKKHRQVAPIMTTRGCPFACEYCGGGLVTGRKLRCRPVESVVAEIKDLYERFGVRGFNVVDDNFTMNLPYAKQVCRAILKLNLEDVSFASINGVRMEYLDEELLGLMKQVGWEYISIAPESGSQKTLDNMRKHLKLSLLKEKIALIRSAGLKVFGFFMLGYPGETADDIQMTIDCAAKNDFDIVTFQCFQPLPGTPVYEKLLASGEIQPHQDSRTALDIQYAPAGMTPAQLKRWFFWAYCRFYMWPPRRLRAVLSYIPLRNFWRFLCSIKVVPSKNS